MPHTSGYVAANGVNYWFDIRGKGEPLLLLHGGLFTPELFGPVLTTLAEHRCIIAVHLHGHGRTALGERKINLIDIGRDLSVVIQKLDLQQVDAMGYSFVCAKRILSRDVAAAGRGRRGHGERDEGDADVTSPMLPSRPGPTISRGCSTQWASSCDSHTTGPRA